MITTFTISSTDGDHLGFLALETDGPQSRSGSLMFKPQVASARAMNTDGYKILEKISANRAFPFTVDSSNALVFKDEESGQALGRIEERWLSIGEQYYELDSGSSGD